MSEAVEDEVATKLQAGYRLAGPFKIHFTIFLIGSLGILIWSVGILNVVIFCIVSGACGQGKKCDWMKKTKRRMKRWRRLRR